jgi:hypothetical protein
MNSTTELLVDLFAFSFGFWLIYGFYAIIRVQRFIVKRYEEETDLLNTVFFKEHVAFARYLPDYFSSIMYTGHLMMCLWGWWLYKNKKLFRDVDNPEIVTKQFSTKEIRKVKRLSSSLIAICLHAVILYVSRFLWPDVFD